METRVLVVFATSSEAEIIHKIAGVTSGSDDIKIGKCKISLLVTGVGGMSTAWGMKQWLSNNPKPDLAINAGIAGSYSSALKTGEVVMPVTDCFADMGIESGNKFITLAEAGLADPDRFPFKGGVIHSHNKYSRRAESILNKVIGITVNTCSGSSPTIERLRNKFNPDIETMEGATFFYICARERIPFLSVRAISNKVEPGNRDSWDIKLALENLALKMKELFLTLE
jgi:futalosine hydrolase